MEKEIIIQSNELDLINEQPMMFEQYSKLREQTNGLGFFLYQGEFFINVVNKMKIVKQEKEDGRLFENFKVLPIFCNTADLNDPSTSPFTPVTVSDKSGLVFSVYAKYIIPVSSNYLYNKWVKIMSLTQKQIEKYNVAIYFKDIPRSINDDKIKEEFLKRIYLLQSPKKDFIKRVINKEFVRSKLETFRLTDKSKLSEYMKILKEFDEKEFQGNLVLVPINHYFYLPNMNDPNLSGELQSKEDYCVLRYEEPIDEENSILQDMYGNTIKIENELITVVQKYPIAESYNYINEIFAITTSNNLDILNIFIKTEKEKK